MTRWTRTAVNRSAVEAASTPPHLATRFMLGSNRTLKIWNAVPDLRKVHTFDKCANAFTKSFRIGCETFGLGPIIELDDHVDDLPSRCRNFGKSILVCLQSVNQRHRLTFPSKSFEIVTDLHDASLAQYVLLTWIVTLRDQRQFKREPALIHFCKTDSSSHRARPALEKLWYRINPAWQAFANCVGEVLVRAVGHASIICRPSQRSLVRFLGVRGTGRCDQYYHCCKLRSHAILQKCQNPSVQSSNDYCKQRLRGYRADSSIKWNGGDHG